MTLSVSVNAVCVANTLLMCTDPLSATAVTSTSHFVAGYISPFVKYACDSDTKLLSQVDTANEIL